MWMWAGRGKSATTSTISQMAQAFFGCLCPYLMTGAISVSTGGFAPFGGMVTAAADADNLPLGHVICTRNTDSFV